MAQGVPGGTRRWITFDVVWLVALLVGAILLWSPAHWERPGLFVLIVSMTVVLDTLSRHYDDAWGLRFTAGSLVPLAMAAVLLGPVPAAIIGGAGALLDSWRMKARPPYLWGNALNWATVGLLGGALADAAVRPLDGGYYAFGAFAVLVGIDLTNVSLTVTYMYFVGRTWLATPRAYISDYLPWVLLSGLVVAGVAYGYRAGGLGVLALFSVAVVLCQFMLLRIDRVQGKLRSERDVHRRYLQMVATAVVSLDDRLRVAFANRRAVELLAVGDLESVVGRDWGELFGHSECGRYAALIAGHSSEERFDVHVGPRLVEWHATVVGDEAGGSASLLLAGEDVTARRAEEQRMEFLAYNDTLTGLPNAARFESDLAATLDGDRPAALLLIDLDDFKHVNDTYGHEAGDRVLSETAARLRAIKGRDDLLARGESDEFLIWIADLGVDLDDTAGVRSAAASIAEAIARTFDSPFPVAGTVPGISVSVSVSMALFPHDALQPLALRGVADAAMNGIKQRAASRAY